MAPPTLTAGQPGVGWPASGDALIGAVGIDFGDGEYGGSVALTRDGQNVIGGFALDNDDFAVARVKGGP